MRQKESLGGHPKRWQERRDQTVPANAGIAELEARITALEEGVNNQKDMIQSIHKEHKKRLRAMESRHKAIMDLQVCPTMMTNYGC